MFSGRKHNFISGIILKEFFDKLLFNVLIQHHGRINPEGHDIIVNKYKLCKNYKYCLEELKTEDENCIINYKRDILSPYDTNWNDFLYIIGTLIEKGVEAIKLFHK